MSVRSNAPAIPPVSALSPHPASAPPSLATAPPPSTPTWTFTQGLLLGQLSFILLTLLFMRYVVFSPESSAPASATAAADRRARFEQRRAARAKLSTTAPPPAGAAQLLQGVEYDMASHGLEGVGWGNVLAAQVIGGYRADLLRDQGEEGARRKVEGWLNPGLAMGGGGERKQKEGGLAGAGGGGSQAPPSSASWLDPIEVTGISLGTGYPLLSNARVRPADAKGNIRAEIDLDYTDTASLALSTSVLINFPRPRFAVLPVSIGVELVSFGGTLSVSIHNPTNERQHMHICLLPDFHLNLKTTSLLGSRAKLQDIPKLEQLILSRLRHIITTRLVHPAHLTLALPRLISASSTSSLSSPRAQSPVPAGLTAHDSVSSPPTPTGPALSHNRPRSATATASVGTSTSAGTGLGRSGARAPTADRVIADFGDAAVEAMGDAVREGWERMVKDLSGVGAALGGLADPGPGTGSASVSAPTVGGSTRSGVGAGAGTGGRSRPAQIQTQSQAGIDRAPGSAVQGGTGAAGPGAAGAGPGVTKRKITMPPGFPHSGTSTSVATPLLSPGRAGGGWSSALPPIGPGSGSVGRPQAEEDERFRFGGQFSSQPPTPAGGPGGQGARRTGAMNSAGASASASAGGQQGRGQYAS